MLASIYPTTDNDDSIPLQIYHCALLPSSTLRHHTNANQCQLCKKYKYNGVQILEIQIQWRTNTRDLVPRLPPSVTVGVPDPPPHPAASSQYLRWPTSQSQCHATNTMPCYLHRDSNSTSGTRAGVPITPPSQTESYHFFGIFLLIKNQHHLSVTCVSKRAFYFHLTNQISPKIAV